MSKCHLALLSGIYDLHCTVYRNESMEKDEDLPFSSAVFSASVTTAGCDGLQFVLALFGCSVDFVWEPH